MGSRRTGSMRQETTVETQLNDFTEQDLFWGTRKPAARQVTDASRHSSPRRSPRNYSSSLKKASNRSRGLIGSRSGGQRSRANSRNGGQMSRANSRSSNRSVGNANVQRQYSERRSMRTNSDVLRHRTHRSAGAELREATPPEEPEVPVVPKEVKRDALGKKIYAGPMFAPGARKQQFEPEHTTRASVFKKDLDKALKSDEVPTLLAIYSMALDMDALNNNTSLMLATHHEVKAIKKRLRMLLKKKIDAAIQGNDIAALKALFEEMNKDKLFKAVSGFPEVHRGRAFLRLRTAHLSLESHTGGGEEAQLRKVKALDGATRRAKRVRALTELAEESSALLALHQGAEKADAAGSLNSTAASARLGASPETVDEENEEEFAEEEGEDVVEDEEEGEDVVEDEEEGEELVEEDEEAGEEEFEEY